MLEAPERLQRHLPVERAFCSILLFIRFMCKQHEHGLQALMEHTSKGSMAATLSRALRAASSKAVPRSPRKGYSRLMCGGHRTNALSLKQRTSCSLSQQLRGGMRHTALL